MSPAERKAKDAGQKSNKARFDPYIGTKSVTGLDHYTFDDFLLEKDAALVMFYDPSEPNCDWSKLHFIKAAKTTERTNHAFAAVDCTKETDVCSQETVADLAFPVFKLYSRGTLIDTYTDHRSFLYFTMKKFVEKVPLVVEPSRPKNPCSIKKKPVPAA